MTLRRRAALAGFAAAAGLGALGLHQFAARLPSPARIAAAYARPLALPNGPLRTFHLGHSLVGRDMPVMLAQLAGPGHSHDSQLGWGTSLRAHWLPGVPVEGFARENAHDRFRPAREAVASGDYDAVILTEMVELLDALRYHESGDYLTRWAALARSANPATRVYLYETWHALDDPRGFLDRIDADLPALWEGQLLAADLRHSPDRPINVVPAGQVLARVVRAAEAKPLPGLQRREDLFARGPDGAVDPIHLNDIGAYLVAVTHFATLYHRSPVGSPHRLNRADGTAADAPTPEAAHLIQTAAWQVVTGYPKTGVAG